MIVIVINVFIIIAVVVIGFFKLHEIVAVTILVVLVVVMCGQFGAVSVLVDCAAGGLPQFTVDG